MRLTTDVRLCGLSARTAHIHRSLPPENEIKIKINKTNEKSMVGYPETTQKEVGEILNPPTMKKLFFLSISLLLLVVSLQAQYVEFSAGTSL